MDAVASANRERVFVFESAPLEIGEELIEIGNENSGPKYDERYEIFYKAIKARFPDLIAEVPRSFERPVQGRLPLYRVGWAMIRPQAAGAPAK